MLVRDRLLLRALILATRASLVGFNCSSLRVIAVHKTPYLNFVDDILGTVPKAACV